MKISNRKLTKFGFGVIIYSILIGISAPPQEASACGCFKGIRNVLNKGWSSLSSFLRSVAAKVPEVELKLPSFSSIKSKLAGSTNNSTEKIINPMDTVGFSNLNFPLSGTTKNVSRDEDAINPGSYKTWV